MDKVWESENLTEQTMIDWQMNIIGQNVNH